MGKWHRWLPVGMVVAGFGGTLAVHLSCFFRSAPLVDFEILFFPLFFVFMGTVIFRVIANSGKSPETVGQEFRGRRDSAPGWVTQLMGGCFIYALLQFALLALGSDGGGQAHAYEDGRFVMQYKESGGVRYEEITAEQYWSWQNGMLRTMSGFLLPFWGAVALFAIPWEERREGLSGIGPPAEGADLGGSAGRTGENLGG